jgi:hypothetical protein
MYPKSPFKAGTQHAVYTNVRDDNIIHYNTDLISCIHDKCTFLKIRGHVNKINEQLYHLKISNKYIGDHPCDSEMAPQIKNVMTKLNMIKQTMRVKAMALMEKYEKLAEDAEATLKEGKHSASFVQPVVVNKAMKSIIRKSKSFSQ